MTSIDPRHRIAEVLRQQAASVQVGQRAAQSAGTGAKPRAGSSSRVPATVTQRIEAIAADDPQRRHKAVRIFLESALLRELGPRLAHDTAFPAMVDAVQHDLQEDAELARAVDQLGDLLLRDPAAP